MPQIEPRYLGDGVYASFDGYHIRLHVGDHRAESCVAIEPDVLAAMNDYYRDIVRFYAPRRLADDGTTTP